MKSLRGGYDWVLLGGVIAGLWLVLAVAPATAADYSPQSMRSGEELYDSALLGVDVIDGEVQLRMGRSEPGLLAPGYTMSYCGQELAPTLENLRSMIGKACRSWALGKKKTMAYHRLEFQCR